VTDSVNGGQCHTLAENVCNVYHPVSQPTVSWPFGSVPAVLRIQDTGDTLVSLGVRSILFQWTMDEAELNLYNFEDEEYCDSRYVLTSPRSLQACDMLSIQVMMSVGKLATRSLAKNPK